MQGKLSEIDIRSILQLIELGQRTGELFVEAYPFQSTAMGELSAMHLPEARTSKLLAGKFWFVFFVNGQIIYAADTDASLYRLSDYLRRYKVEKTLSSLTVPSISSINAPEYGYLWALLENHILTPAQGRSIIQGMVHETLFDLLSLHQGAFIFEVSPPLSPQLTTLEIAPLLAKIMKQVQEWKQLNPYLQSPDQCPVLADIAALQTSLSPKTLVALEHYADGKTSIRQIARYLNRDILTVGRAIYPYVQHGAIQLNHVEEAKVGTSSRFPRSRELAMAPEARSPRIVCIDDGVTVRETVEYILNQHGYDATGLGDPLEALSQVFRLQPDLILCDIAMPELDGYEVCAMLRKSTAFRQIPIVMLTGKDGFIDRVRARMVGATDYLTKPFGESELLMLVEKYVGLGYPERCSSDRGMAETAKDGLEIEMSDVTSTPSAPFN
ncbi:response regulator [Pantanalinema rosaneae CENA516]|uniref:response regulator n=1 Tax=Pantanalinema rosaneae TaxID=1620701 RepID=UPI003D6DCF3C